MSNTYKLGTSVKISVAFTDVDGVAADPTLVTCKVQKPNDAAGIETLYTYPTDAALVKDSVGNYHLWIETDQVGTYVYGFEGAGVVDVSNDDTFDVETNFR